jgi:hypothetical protein
MELRIQTGQASPEDFSRLRKLILGHTNRAARASGQTAEAGDPQRATEVAAGQELLDALAALEQRVRSGGEAPLVELQRMRLLMGENGSRPASEAAGGAAGGEVPSVGGIPAVEPPVSAGGDPAQDLLAELEHLEQRALTGQATAEDYEHLRAKLITRARRGARQQGQGSEASLAPQRLLQALPELRRKAEGGEVGNADFAAMRGLLNPVQAPLAAASDETGGVSARPAGPARPRYGNRLVAALDQLAGRALQGSATAEDFQRLSEQVKARAEQTDREGTGMNALSPELAMRLQGALADLEQRTASGQVQRSDFDAVREMIAGQAADGVPSREVEGTATPPPAPPADSGKAGPDADGRTETRRGNAKHKRQTGPNQQSPGDAGSGGVR